MTYELSHLDALESEAIHLMREVAAEFERPALLFSGGKDSIVLLRLAEKAFRPGRFPFPLMHVDTGHNFPEVIEFRDRRVAELGERLIVASVQETIDKGRAAEDKGPRASRNRQQTQTLLDAIDEHEFDACFGGARRDEERARAKERMLSFRDDFGQWDPRAQRPELWNLYNGRIRKGENVRAFPISNWTELDVWQYIEREELELPSIYFAHEREVFERDGMLYAVSEFVELMDGEESFTTSVRYRTVGDLTITGAVRSEATTLDGRRRRDRRHPGHRARRDPRRRPRHRGRHGRPQARGLLLGVPMTASRRQRQPRPHRHRRLGRRRQVDPDRAAALRLQGDPRRPAGAHRRTSATAAASRSSTSRCSRTACAPSASRASPSTSPTATSRRRGARSSSPTRPGHAQYTRNMVTGASTADVAIVLLDAREGPTEQSRRHTFIASLLGIRHIVFAINKMDLVDWDEAALRRDRRRDDGLQRAAGPRATRPSSRSARCTATTSSIAARTAPGTAGRRCCGTSSTCTSRRTAT